MKIGNQQTNEEKNLRIEKVMNDVNFLIYKLLKKKHF